MCHFGEVSGLTVKTEVTRYRNKEAQFAVEAKTFFHTVETVYVCYINMDLDGKARECKIESKNEKENKHKSILCGLTLSKVSKLKFPVGTFIVEHQFIQFSHFFFNTISSISICGIEF